MLVKLTSIEEGHPNSFIWKCFIENWETKIASETAKVESQTDFGELTFCYITRKLEGFKDGKIHYGRSQNKDVYLSRYVGDESWFKLNAIERILEIKKVLVESISEIKPKALTIDDREKTIKTIEAVTEEFIKENSEKVQNHHIDQFYNATDYEWVKNVSNVLSQKLAKFYISPNIDFSVQIGRELNEYLLVGIMFSIENEGNQQILSDTKALKDKALVFLEPKEKIITFKNALINLLNNSKSEALPKKSKPSQMERLKANCLDKLPVEYKNLVIEIIEDETTKFIRNI